MGYPCQVFHASELPERVQTDHAGRKRKLNGGASKVDLTGCELLEMLQYKCEIKEPVTWNSPVQCFAVDRLFRRCQDRKGSFTVETTGWEGKAYEAEKKSAKGGKTDETRPAQHYQWAPSWTAPDTAK